MTPRVIHVTFDARPVTDPAPTRPRPRSRQRHGAPARGVEVGLAAGAKGAPGRHCADAAAAQRHPQAAVRNCCGPPPSAVQTASAQTVHLSGPSSIFRSSRPESFTSSNGAASPAAAASLAASPPLPPPFGTVAAAGPPPPAAVSRTSSCATSPLRCLPCSVGRRARVAHATAAVCGGGRVGGVSAADDVGSSGGGVAIAVVCCRCRSRSGGSHPFTVACCGDFG